MKIIYVCKFIINIYDIFININEINYKISFNMKIFWYNWNVKELLRNECLKIFFEYIYVICLKMICKINFKNVYRNLL